MRLVYSQEERKDRTQGQRTLRKLLEESPKEFIAQLARLEEAHARRGAKAAPPPGEEPAQMDEGTERIRDLLAEEWRRADRYFAFEERALAEGGEGCQPGRCRWAQVREEARARGLGVPDRETRRAPPAREEATNADSAGGRGRPAAPPG